MGILNAESILAVQDMQLEKVDVPEWGGEVYIKSLTGAERDAFEQTLYTEKIVMGRKQIVQDMDNARAKFLVMCICDEKGNLLFNKAQAIELGKKSANVLSRLFEIARNKNGMSDQDLMAAIKN